MSRCLLMLAVALGPMMALASEQPVAQNYQAISGGNCNVIINNTQSGQVVVPQVCSNWSSSKSAAQSLRKLERFFEAANPTEVEVSQVGLKMWLGDPERYLTLSLTNVSNLPADRVKVRLLAPLEAHEKTSRALTFSPSRAYPTKLLANLRIPKLGSTEIPIGPESELIILTKRRVPVGYDFLGVGLSPKLPPGLEADYVERKGVGANYQLSSQSAALAIELRYENIFEGKTTSLRGLYVYYGQVRPLGR